MNYTKQRSNQFLSQVKSRKIDLGLLALFLISTPVMELMNKPIGRVYNLYSGIDQLIPFVPEFVLIYHSWLPCLTLLGLCLFWHEARPRQPGYENLQKGIRKGIYIDYTLSLIFGQALAHLTFPFFQTYVTRHPFDQAPSNFFEQLVYGTYQVDNPYCGFPSIHVLTSCLAIVACLRSSLPLWAKLLFTCHFCLIISSTLLIKQHVFWDLPGGMVYAAVGLACLPLTRRLAKSLGATMLA